MSDEPAQGAKGEPKSSTRARLSKILPTDRISFPKQLQLLQAYAAGSSGGSVALPIKEVAKLAELKESTISVAHAFLVDSGLLKRTDSGMLPSEDVINFQHAIEWDNDQAAHKLAPVLSGAWFAKALIPALSIKPLEEAEAIARLAEVANAGPIYRGQLMVLLAYMEAAGLILRDGGQVRKGPSVSSNGAKGPQAGQTPLLPGGKPEVEDPPPPPPPTPRGEGGTELHFDLRVSMSEMKEWEPSRIGAFFAGVAQVLAAKGGAEKEQ